MLYALIAQIQLAPEQASTIAPRYDALYNFLVGLTAFFTILIAVLILVFAVRYRRRAPLERGTQVIASMTLEYVWTGIPLVIVLVIFGWSAVLYMDIARPPDDTMEVYVTGRQWMWHVQHMGGQRENNELHVPTGRPVRLTMTSADVMHNFSLPAFRVRSDVFPGRYTTMWFHATRPGKYHLFCAEYCGTDHSQMVGWVYAMEPAEFENWLTSERVDGSLANRGRKLFLELQCITCHAADSKARAPLLEEVYNATVPLQDGATVPATEAYLRESILYPEEKIVAGYRPIMPSYAGQITEDELLAVVAFLKGLGRGETPPRLGNVEPPEKLYTR